MQIIEKTTSKKCFFIVEGTEIDNTFNEYIDGKSEKIVVEEYKKNQKEK